MNNVDIKMSDTIKKLTSVYFSHFYRHAENWKILIQKSEALLPALQNQCEQLIHVEKANIEKEFSDFPDIKERLVFKILMGIEDELSQLNQIMNELNVVTQELRTKLMNFERSTTDIDWNDETIVNGTALQPSLSDLLQMGLEGWQIYNNLHQNIANSYKCLDIRNLNSIHQLKISLNKNDEENVNHIIALTQYCYNNE